MGASLVTPGKPLDTPVAGSCECGKVVLEFTEAPYASFKCHCTNCYKFRKMKTLESPEDIDTRQPVVGLFRDSAVRVVKGKQYIEYENTRGSCPFLTGVGRGYCRECKTPGVIEHFRDFHYNFLFGNSKFVYLGYVCPNNKEMNEFTFHHCYDTATDKAKEIADNDGRAKHHLFVGTLRVLWQTFVNSSLVGFIVALCFNPLLWLAIVWYYPGGTILNSLSTSTWTWIFQAYCLVVALFEVPQLINILLGKPVSSFNRFMPPGAVDSRDGRVVWASVMAWFIVPRCFAALYPSNRELLQLVAAIHVIEIPLFFFTGFCSKRKLPPKGIVASIYTYVLANPVLFAIVSFLKATPDHFTQEVAGWISVGLIGLMFVIVLITAIFIGGPGDDDNGEDDGEEEVAKKEHKNASNPRTESGLSEPLMTVGE